MSSDTRTLASSDSYHEHISDIFRDVLSLRKQGQRVALAFVTETEGGAVRAVGAAMAITDTGESYGYVSGGCIDADVRLQAQSALKSNQPRTVRYGKGSPFIDLPLPCGGAIELTILPDVDRQVLEQAVSRLDNARESCHLGISKAGGLVLEPSDQDDIRHVFQYHPKLRLRIAGRGADALALARLAQASGVGVSLHLVDDADIEVAGSLADIATYKLASSGHVPSWQDDSYTAFVLMFHDPDWEDHLLIHALSGPCFFVGAVGSRRTQAARKERLQEAGVSAEDLERLKGPIGLVPSMRDASMLAISALSEIISEYAGMVRHV